MLIPILPQFLLIGLKLIGFFFQFYPLIHVLDDHLLDPLLLSLIFLLLFPNPFDPPCSHLNMFGLENLFFISLHYLLSEKCHAFLFYFLEPAKRSLLLDNSDCLQLLVNEYLAREAFLNIPLELSEPRVEVL